MPGFATHYLFGLNTYQKLTPSALTDCIARYPHAYGLGLQGPDLFFYDPLSFLRRFGNPGSLAHKQHTGSFLQHLIQSRELFSDRTRKNIASAYICGFLGHYILDSSCHPYIYAKSHYGTYTRDYFGHHIYLETDIDAMLLKYYKNCVPSKFHPQRTIALSHKQRCVIATMLHYAYHKTYPTYSFCRPSMYAAICAMQIGTRLLCDPSGQKKAFARKIEAKTCGYACFSPLIPSDCYTFTADPLNLRHYRWRNPWDSSLCSNQSFFDLLDEAGARHLAVLTLYAKLITATPKNSKRLLRFLLKKLGNNSYGSGLPLTD